MDKLTKEKRRQNMQAIKAKNTDIENILAAALWGLGYRYRRNNSAVYGKPDITFKALKIAIFCDSEFFHGKNWESEKFKISTNQDFWHKKIAGNINRDKKVSNILSEQGYLVLRFWGNDIKKRTEECVYVIENAISERMQMKKNNIIF